MPSGETVCNFPVATTEKWTDKNGNKQEKTEWHRISAFGKLADLCVRFLQKGTSVYLEGQNRTREYEQDGVKRYSTEVVIKEMQVLAGGKQNDAAGGTQSAPPAQRQQSGFDNFSDDRPF